MRELIICDLESAQKLIAEQEDFKNAIVVPMWVKSADTQGCIISVDRDIWDDLVDSGVVMKSKKDIDVTCVPNIPVEWVEKRIANSVGSEHTYLAQLLDDWRKEHENK